MTVLERRTALGATIWDLASRPVLEAGISPRVVDVGARNGMFLLPAEYTSVATLIGFEPNREEYEKLTTGSTDRHAWSAHRGQEIPKFKKERYFDCAVWDAEGDHTIYITQGPGACTLMGPTAPLLENTYFLYPWGDARRRRSVHDLHTRVVSENKVACRPLDALLGAGETVDFLKVDVEGGELKVFKGAQRLFDERRILFVQAEFQAFPYYRDHPVFGDQHAFLTRNGMRLIDLDLDHPRYRRGPVDLPDACGRAPLFAGDALFMIDPDRNAIAPLDRQRLALILLAFGFNSLAVGLLVEAALLSREELEAIKSAIAARPDKSRKRRMLDAWNRIPLAVYGALSPALRLSRKRR